LDAAVVGDKRSGESRSIRRKRKLDIPREALQPVDPVRVYRTGKRDVAAGSVGFDASAGARYRDRTAHGARVYAAFRAFYLHVSRSVVHSNVPAGVANHDIAVCGGQIYRAARTLDEHVSVNGLCQHVALCSAHRDIPASTLNLDRTHSLGDHVSIAG